MTNPEIPEAIAENEQTGLLTLSVKLYMDPKLKVAAEVIDAKQPSFEEIKPLLSNMPLRFCRRHNR